eukprot:5419616-Pleurochrysis_carterae.AAC.1
MAEAVLDQTAARDRRSSTRGNGRRRLPLAMGLREEGSLLGSSGLLAKRRASKRSCGRKTNAKRRPREARAPGCEVGAS